jgi:hypothetical protein
VIPKLDGFNVNSPKVFGLYCTKALLCEIEVIGHDPPVYPLHPVNPPDSDDLAIVLESTVAIVVQVLNGIELLLLILLTPDGPVIVDENIAAPVVFLITK